MKVDVGMKLLQANLVSEEDLRRAQKIEQQDAQPLSTALIKLGVISEDRLLSFLSELYETPAVNLEQITIDPLVVKAIPVELATKNQVMPIARSGRLLRVAMANPANFFVIDDIKFNSGLEVEVCVSTEGQIKRAIDKYYDQADSMANMMKSMETEEDVEVVDSTDDEQVSGAALSEEAPVVKFVNTLMAEAVRRGASDIHIEPYEKKLRVRFRIDGTLYEMMSPPNKMKAAILSRLKIMAELDIAERRVPQDGRIRIRLAGRTIDLRVSTLPTIFGEKIVMRILDKGNLALDLTKLGFEPGPLSNFLRAVESPYGMVLVTGPTGSGKTTTLYSALSRVNLPGVNIMTAEDPVEYNLEGINQVNVNDAVDLTFSAALKAFLRQDPNIIMVGEIRDKDTASIAIKAALTGHLVFSTVHTNDAPSTINRMIDMGIEPFLVASATNLILAQRLVRRICPKCKEQVTLSDEVMRELQLSAARAEGATFMKGKGCYDCNNTGYRGRQGIYEVMPVSTKVRDMILARRPTSEIKNAAIKEGMLTLRMDALEKLKRGITSVEEVLKESAPDDEAAV
ncbi:MAG: type IV-A pilus assembly ATPase PilB [Candidatus Eisenbacteria bacterium]|nr:type IV-A pilus assembly ATPase PilB [Candidatus Eisenbacteria bacterium]MCC7141695.1 type IV-A pilus assembly ATPase PilB [Candidatus Eisenbacteria bacterium]